MEPLDARCFRNRVIRVGFESSRWIVLEISLPTGGRISAIKSVSSLTSPRYLRCIDGHRRVKCPVNGIFPSTDGL